MHYLRWLAQQMEKAGKTEYLIEEMQPSWLLPAYRLLYRLIVGLIVGLIFGLSGGLIFGLSSGLIFGLSSGLIFGLSGGLIFGLILGLIFELETTIKPGDKLTWSTKQGLIGGVIGGVIGGTFFGLIVGLVVGLEKVSLEEKDFPNQGIRKLLQSILKITLIFGLIGGLRGGLAGGLESGLDGGLIFGLAGGLFFGLAGGLIFGLNTVVQHYTLRFLLAQEGNFPWDCVRFLDHAAKHRFIQRVGGRYRFMHDLLRKHFAYGELPSFPSR
ncbi:MAG: hypothetical protein F6K42_36150 [Leptolyngbya sp. SIO1D8]|nr:hypothetical protein [Leptolyngbya sp. SIO1D8]